MILLDTHAWIWLAAEPTKLSQRAKQAVNKAKRLGVSAISCWEVAMLCRKERIRLDRPVLDWIEQALALDRVELWPISHRSR